MNLRKKVLQWLKQYTNDPRTSLSYFTGGGLLFAVGMMAIILAEKLIEDGLYQELTAFFGLLVTLIGGILAIWGYLGISVFKILIYILERDDDNQSGT